MELGGDRQAEVRWISPVFHQPANTHQVTNIRHLTIQDLSCDQSGSVNCVMFEGRGCELVSKYIVAYCLQRKRYCKCCELQKE